MLIADEGLSEVQVSEAIRSGRVSQLLRGPATMSQNSSSGDEAPPPLVSSSDSDDDAVVRAYQQREQRSPAARAMAAMQWLLAEPISLRAVELQHSSVTRPPPRSAFATSSSSTAPEDTIEKAVQQTLDLLDKNQLAEQDEGVPQEKKQKSNFETGDKHKIEKAAQQTLDLLDKNQLAEKDEGVPQEKKQKRNFETGDKHEIEKATQHTLDLRDKNQLAEKDEERARRQGHPKISLMVKVYQAGCMSGCCPTVEEVD